MVVVAHVLAQSRAPVPVATDFTDPANPFVRAYSDPEPIVPTQLGGAWSSYWYNANIYESSITEGLNVFRYTERGIRRRSLRLDHLNPQTQEFSLRSGSVVGESPAPEEIGQNDGGADS